MTKKTGIPEYKHTPPPPQKSQNKLNKVTTERLHMFMRLCGIHLEPRMVDHIIDCVEIVAKKGGEASVNDAVELEDHWKKQNP